MDPPDAVAIGISAKKHLRESDGLKKSGPAPCDDGARSMRTDQSMIRKSGYRFSLGTTRGVCPEIMLKQEQDDESKKSHLALASAAEEQPQQNDYRDRHAQQPKQNSSSHFSLHDSSWKENAKRNPIVPAAGTGN
jgi:FPC/CPF motif-containing protein YcgG